MKARQFLNVVTKYGRNGTYSLNRINPQEHLFYPSAEEAQAAATAPPAKKPNMLSPLSSMVPGWKESKLRFEATRSDKRLDFLPFYGGRGSKSNILCTDSAGHAVLCDVDSGIMEAVPCLNELKGPSPISFSITRDDSPDRRRPDALYVMGRFPVSSNSCSFEALVYAEDGWQWHPLQSPPWVNDPTYECSEIQSCALLNGGSTLCVSSHRTIGTYCFDVPTGVWSKAGSWTLPFRGRAEHVPELGNLWFSISNNNPHRLCALDLSSFDMNRAPCLVHDFEQLDLPEDWVEIKGSLLYLGAGKFCITTIFHIEDQDTKGDPVDLAAVLTGVEVVGGPSGKLQMIKHKSFISNDVHCVL